MTNSVATLPERANGSSNKHCHFVSAFRTWLDHQGPKKLYLINIILLKRKKKKKHKTERKMVRSNLRLVSLFSYVKAANVVL